MIDRRYWSLIALGVVVYAFVTYLILTQRAPFSFTDIFEFLAQQFTSIYAAIFGYP